MAGSTGRFSRADRSLRSRDFERVGRAGKRFASQNFVLLIASPRERESDRQSRLGVTVSRRVGNAVTRNRVKRGIREWFRQSRGRTRESVDLVVIARGPAAALSSRDIARDLDALLRQHA